MNQMHKKIVKHIKQNKGGVTALLIILGVVIVIGGLLAGVGFTPTKKPFAADDIGEIIVDPNAADKKEVLQINTLGVRRITVTPSPAAPAPKANACITNPFNEEPDIFLASDPAPGALSVAGSQMKVWVDDGNGGSISQNEIVDPTTGKITTPGDRTATDGKGANYYLWEPAIYLTPISSPGMSGPYIGDSENGGTPHFPTIIKGEISYAGTGNRSGFVPNIPPIDPPVNVVGGRKGHGGHIAEFIWDVNTLGLTPGSGYYRAQIVVHDGDGDLAINCTTIQL